MDQSNTGNTHQTDNYPTNDTTTGNTEYSSGNTGYSSGTTTQPTTGKSNDYSTGATNQTMSGNTDVTDYQSGGSAQSGNAPPVGQFGQSVVSEETKAQNNKKNYGGTGSRLYVSTMSIPICLPSLY